MKLTLSLQHGSKTAEHSLELESHQRNAGSRRILEYLLDGEVIQADCVQIAPGVYSVLLGGRSYEAQVVPIGPHAPGAPNRRMVTVGSRHFTIDVRDPRRRRAAGALGNHTGPQEILAPMPGKIVKVLAEKGQEVVQGAGLLVIEAMKMQNELRAPRAGRVAEIYIAEGAGVESGARLMRLL
ncbi:MAG: acetyl-CoA carboxylase biotin carboxyl carrier protein subunit [Acidobacteria bacterium]|nr:acetyl-CoA carboxylase biotin carboxyl carrier protein subunit [Acidobacteriota bacterium]